MRLVMVNEGGDTLFSGDSTMLKSHVAAYTRKDGAFVRDHDRHAFTEGAAVKVTGKVQGQGKTGVIHETAPSGHFHIVEHDDGSKSSYHESDLSLHDGDDEDDDDLQKSHVAAYTRKDGTFVKEHDDKRQKKMPEQSAVDKWHDDNPAPDDDENHDDGFGAHPHVVGKFSSHKVNGEGGRGEKDGNGDPTHPSTTSVSFAGKQYKPTGKTGQSLHDKTPVHEFESDDGHRVWGDASGRVHADSSDEVDHLRGEHEKQTGNDEGEGRIDSDDAFSKIRAAGGKNVTTTSGHINYFHNGVAKKIAHKDADDGNRYVNESELNDHLSSLGGASSKPSDKKVLFTKPAADSGKAPYLGKHADALAKLRKPGEIDYQDFQSAASYMKEGDAEGLKKYIQHLDTAARDDILDHIHPDLWESLGTSALDKGKSVAAYDKKFGGAKPASKSSGKYDEDGDGGRNKYSVGAKSGGREGGIHPISAHPSDVEKKLGLKAGSLGDADGHYSQTHTVTDKDGNSHHVYANDGEVRVRPVGKATPESTKALKEHLDGVGSGSPDYEGAGKAKGEMKHGDAYSADNLPKKGEKVSVGGKVGEVLAAHGSRVSVWHEGKDGGGDVSEAHPTKVFAHKK